MSSPSLCVRKPLPGRGREISDAEPCRPAKAQCGRRSNLFDRSVRATSAPIAVEKLQPHNWTALRKVIPGSAGLPTVRRRPRFVPARSCSEQAVEMVYRHLSDRIHSASRLIVTLSATGRFPRTRGPRSRERSRYASPPFGLRSLTQTWRALAPTFPRVGVRVMFGSYARRRPILLPVRRRPRRVSTLHAEGLLSPRPARRQIGRRNPHDRAPRPPRRRLRHLGHPTPRNPALRRLLRRPRLSRPAPRQANRRHAAPPPRQRRRRLMARRSKEERRRLFLRIERTPGLPAHREPNRPLRA